MSRDVERAARVRPMSMFKTDSESSTPVSQYSFFVTFRVSLTVFAIFQFYSFDENYVISKWPLGGVQGQSS